MNKLTFVKQLAIVASIGFASQAFGHAGTKADPLPAAAAAKGVPLPATGKCPAGDVELWHRTTVPSNAPAHLKAACYTAANAKLVEAELYTGEKAPAAAAKGHAGTKTDPLPSAAGPLGVAMVGGKCPAGDTALWHRTTVGSNDPAHLKEGCYKKAVLAKVHAELYTSEK